MLATPSKFIRFCVCTYVRYSDFNSCFLESTLLVSLSLKKKKRREKKREKEASRDSQRSFRELASTAFHGAFAYTAGVNEGDTQLYVHAATCVLSHLARIGRGIFFRVYRL